MRINVTDVLLTIVRVCGKDVPSPSATQHRDLHIALLLALRWCVRKMVAFLVPPCWLVRAMEWPG